MRTLLLLGLICLVMSGKITEEDQVRIEKLKQSKWGSILFSLAELHTAAEGPVNDLVKAIGDLYNDLLRQQETESKTFQSKTLAHEKYSEWLQNSIRKAQTDIVNTASLLANTLRPMKKTLEANIRQLKKNIAHNLKIQAQTTQERNEEHARFEATAREHREAIAALDQAIQVVDALKNPSLAQVSILRTHIIRVARALTVHDKFTPLIEGLLEMSTLSKLKDITAIRSCLKLLNELRQSILDDLNEYIRLEGIAVANYKKRMTQLGDELSEFRASLTRNVEDLQETIKKIKTGEAFLATRNMDLKQYQRDLKRENDYWVKETQLYNDVSSEIELEISTIKQVVGFIKNANFKDWLKGKLASSGAKFHKPGRK